MALLTLSTADVADKGVPVDIFHPTTGEPLDMRWFLRGSDSQAYLDSERKIHNRQLEHGKRVKDFAAGLTYDQQESAKVEKMAACVIGWEEKGKDGNWKKTIELAPGEELECTPENVKKVLKNRGFFWLRQQVQKGIDDPTNFLPKAPGSSSPAPSIASNMTAPEKAE